MLSGWVHSVRSFPRKRESGILTLGPAFAGTNGIHSNSSRVAVGLDAEMLDIARVDG
ncbi:hypothetical protein DFP91_3597 [Pseudorhodoplanes sinuspersici]|nr:hypothetical protein DFP91_3597 [Pseudorhodoplanes sinuspersici]